MGSTLRHLDDIARCAESQEDAESRIGKVNNMYSKSKTTEIKCETYRTSENLEDTDAEVIVDDEHIEVVEHFKYLG